LILQTRTTGTVQQFISTNVQRLGQHFLKDKKVLERIASSLEISNKDTVVEIGPGHGELTHYILEKSPKKIVLIERDTSLAENLLGISDNTEVIAGDALEIITQLKIKNYKLVGNIPYYITGKLLRTISELETKPELVVLTIQKEVAERLTSKPPKMNLLAASVAFWGEAEIVRSVSRRAFRPMPEVESAIVRIVPHETQKTQEESRKYYAFIRALFKQPRKTILNNLRDGLDSTKEEIEKVLESQGLEPKLRPQNLDADTINILSQSF